jgi:allantoin racemase
MRVHVVTPITTHGFTKQEDFESISRADNEATHSELDTGPASIESEFDEALALPDTIAKILEAERSGADAIVIDCMGDPGMNAGREVTDIPVLGPCHTSMHVAALLAHRFSIVTVLDSVVPMLEDLASKYGLDSKLASIRVVNIPVLELDDHGRMMDGLFEQSVKAIDEDGAHAIVFGCTGMRGCAEALQARLEEAGYGGIPVIDPVVTAFKIAEALVDLGLSPSKKTYPRPRAKETPGFDLQFERATA